ncbi:uncharacterized protein LOC131431194 [Malaya genurostris]|uniref:uncharacterized protein LOC131431194 n=1 Tax=Malaya genurostris TaxID=325434 RepID=UPI0026F39E99|nr:uncharacterized protein LOC131431194 [Malaya genurostris]
MTSRQLWTVVTTVVVMLAIMTGVIDRGVGALDCHFCIGVNHCNVTSEQIEPVTCTEKIVHLTNESLAGFMPTLSSSRIRDREDFQCVHMKATSLTDRTFLFIRGCIFGSIEFCDLRYASFRGTRECFACATENHCNVVSSSEKVTIDAVTVIVSASASAIFFAINHFCNLR